MNEYHDLRTEYTHIHSYENRYNLKNKLVHDWSLIPYNHDLVHIFNQPNWIIKTFTYWRLYWRSYLYSVHSVCGIEIWIVWHYLCVLDLKWIILWGQRSILRSFEYWIKAWQYFGLKLFMYKTSQIFKYMWNQLNIIVWRKVKTIIVDIWNHSAGIRKNSAVFNYV